MDDLKITINIGPDAVKSYFKRLSRSGKIFRIAVFIVLLSSILAYSYTKDLVRENVFVDGDIIYADKVNKNFNDLFDAINELLGSTPNSGVEWFDNEFDEKWTEIDAKIRSNESRYAVVASTALESLPTTLILMWNKEWGTSEDPDGWVLCNGSNGTPNLENYFIFGDGGPISDATPVSNNNTHTHSLEHAHNLATVYPGGAHNHSIFNVNRYLEETWGGLDAQPWNWEVFKSNGDTMLLDDEDPTPLWSNQNAYSFPLLSETYLTFGINASEFDIGGLFEGEDTVSFYTLSAPNHTHTVTVSTSDCYNYGGDTLCSDPGVQTGPGENTPPYHALNFIMKN